VLFALYVAGVGSALAVAFVMKRTVARAGIPAAAAGAARIPPAAPHQFIVDCGRAKIFLTRRHHHPSLMVVLWFLASFPRRRLASGPAIQYSIAGYLGCGVGSARAHRL
jgi:ferrous iron transport protein B